MGDIVIFGAGGHGKVIIDIIEKAGKLNIIGFLDSSKSPGTEVYGYKVLGDESWLIDNKEVGCIVAVGDNWIRDKVVQKITAVNNEINFVSAVHPSASIGRGVTLGEGTVVMAGAIINSDATIGKHCIINTKSSVGHDCNLGDYVTIAPNGTVGGGVEIGPYSALSLSASVIHGKIIGEHCIIGAGSTVLSNIDSYVVAYGTPAKVVRKRKEGDKYL